VKVGQFFNFVVPDPLPVNALNYPAMKKQLLLTSAFALSAIGAWAQCNPCQIPFVASSQATGNSASVTIPVPSGVQAGHVMIAAIHIGWCNSGPTVTAPNGWILINHTSNTGPGCGSSNTTKQLHTFYKVATSTEPSNYTFTGNSSNQAYVGGIVAYSGVNTSNPVNASSNHGMQELCANIVANSVTTTAACTRLVAVFFCSVNSSATNIVPQNSLTERVDVSTTGNNPWGNENMEISDELMTSMGATGNKTAALTGCSGNSWVTGAQLIALNCDLSTGSGDLSLPGMASVSPNPSAGTVNLELGNWKGGKASVEMYNALGEKMFSSPLSQAWTKFEFSHLPKGIYFLKVVTAEGTVTKKVVLE
jgi:hypothetical protein